MVKWIHAYRLMDHNFWDVMMPANASWSWRKLLQISPMIQDHFLHRIRNGGNTSIWYDIWSDHGHLVNVISRRNIIRAGFDGNEKFCDYISMNGWIWPVTWRNEYPLLQTIAPPVLSIESDVVQWVDPSGYVSDFAVAKVWETISRSVFEHRQDR
ncbi:uncharacterized protein [Rutidosis leptorrhynchoides]|uniref:uncharacterized protein n=1 Tax=Rutidosis leptorrhynchoides TaxID=125765 RepID=UPI003A9A66B3